MSDSSPHAADAQPTDAPHNDPSVPHDLPPPVVAEAKAGVKFSVAALVGLIKTALGVVTVIDALVDGPIADTTLGLVRECLQTAIVKLGDKNQEAQAFAQKHNLSATVGPV